MAHQYFFQHMKLPEKKTILLAAELVCLVLACIVFADVYTYRQGWQDGMNLCNISITPRVWDYNFTVMP